MPSNAEIITEFVQAWSKLDAAELAAYFTEDGTYFNMPAQPVSGRDNVEKFIAGFSANWTETTWDILNVRSRVTWCSASASTEPKPLPATSICPALVFSKWKTAKSNWRDYFDMGTSERHDFW